MSIIQFCTILIVTSFILGCSTKGNPSYKPYDKTSFSPSNHNYISKALEKEYRKWDSTPYRYGGENFMGVDCSSFVQHIYKDAFNIKIPRTTKEQVKIGYKVSKNNSRVGDLIFFKTAYDVRHIGIIIEKSRFIHVSQKRGVTKSSLYNPYWRNKYWQIRRVLP